MKKTESRILTRVGEMTIAGETETETAEKETTEIGTGTEEGTEVDLRVAHHLVGHVTVLRVAAARLRSNSNVFINDTLSKLEKILKGRKIS